MTEAEAEKVSCPRRASLRINEDISKAVKEGSVQAGGCGMHVIIDLLLLLIKGSS